ncbi:MAG: hypothetical protein IPI82_18995 [Candidatus Microthrix sp.]|nr:hypothetical protein [Candidatus Microthrix sp.]MBK7324446.1 hypothetical protein [Candidatus Microthrix sp.]
MLERIDAAGSLIEADAAAVQAALEGAVLRCASGLTLTVLYVADEGQFMRTAGPNRMSMVPSPPTGKTATDPPMRYTPTRTYSARRYDSRWVATGSTLYPSRLTWRPQSRTSLMLLNLWIPL